MVPWTVVSPALIRASTVLPPLNYAQQEIPPPFKREKRKTKKRPQKLSLSLHLYPHPVPVRAQRKGPVRTQREVDGQRAEEGGLRSDQAVTP